MSFISHPISDVMAAGSFLALEKANDDFMLGYESGTVDICIIPASESRGQRPRLARTHATVTTADAGHSCKVFVNWNGCLAPDAYDKSARPNAAGLRQAYLTGELSRLAQSTMLLDARRGLISDVQYGALYRQLTSLLGDDENVGTHQVSIISLDALITFLGQHQPNTHPNISLGRDGRFAASWTPSKKQKVTLFFDRDGGDWIGIDLLATPPRATGSFIVSSLSGIARPFRNWIKI
jgi:hypothetical protein